MGRVRYRRRKRARDAASVAYAALDRAEALATAVMRLSSLAFPMEPRSGRDVSQLTPMWCRDSKGVTLVLKTLALSASVLA
ncbi:MAG: hypothetical protein DLM68_06475, partial [Hyphomicrobiales bacterium]